MDYYDEEEEEEEEDYQEGAYADDAYIQLNEEAHRGALQGENIFSVAGGYPGYAPGPSYPPGYARFMNTGGAWVAVPPWAAPAMPPWAAAGLAAARGDGAQGADAAAEAPAAEAPAAALARLSLELAEACAAVPFPDVRVRVGEGEAAVVNCHKCILALASPYFKALLEWPRGDSGDAALQLADASTPAEVAVRLLLFIYRLYTNSARDAPLRQTHHPGRPLTTTDVVAAECFADKQRPEIVLLAFEAASQREMAPLARALLRLLEPPAPAYLLMAAYGGTARDGGSARDALAVYQPVHAGWQKIPVYGPEEPLLLEYGAVFALCERYSHDADVAALAQALEDALVATVLRVQPAAQTPGPENETAARDPPRALMFRVIERLVARKSDFAEKVRLANELSAEADGLAREPVDAFHATPCGLLARRARALLAATAADPLQGAHAPHPGVPAAGVSPGAVRVLLDYAETLDDASLAGSFGRDHAKFFLAHAAADDTLAASALLQRAARARKRADAASAPLLDEALLLDALIEAKQPEALRAQLKHAEAHRGAAPPMREDQLPVVIQGLRQKLNALGLRLANFAAAQAENSPPVMQRAIADLRDAAHFYTIHHG
ncbi:hypothetical protein M885DRAFT_542397 [Pelagophyceae sp. CCMP2097]|nr:hypothetical protein M885DRAFT_542397 [Pelagophyceae sp. CCMP2097]